MSRGEVLTRAFTDVDTTPHSGHAAGSGPKAGVKGAGRRFCFETAKSSK
ncbi:hypothetical protein OEM_21400 [Mycobacterium intracellulare subsp. yongonense 05-1390]|nr:hypothetical protein OEM_21400 [Mycobacterium intracellulare subsp. yongonense 05-1390]